MTTLEINGGKKLSGEIEISGAKNEALKAIAFSILVKSPFKIKNVPCITDVKKQLEIIESIGAKVDTDWSNNEVTIDSGKINKSDIRGEAACSLRASIVLVGPLLARFKTVTFSFPGGCAIGSRPIDTHLKVFTDLGFEVNKKGSTISISKSGEIKNSVQLAEQSVSATENALMCLTGIEGQRIVTNCAIEPEIIHLISNINKTESRIKKISDNVFAIAGSQNIFLKEATMISDRIEAISYLVAFIITGGSGKIVNFPFDDLSNVMNFLNSIGIKYEFDGKNLIVGNNFKIKPFVIKTAPHPGFPTDLQPLMSLLAISATGQSKIKETMFNNRLAYAGELKKMGANITEVDEQNIIIKGPSKLNPCEIESLDLRSGITMVLAALSANGKSLIHHAEIIDRGYEDVVGKLKKIGADIERISEPDNRT